MEWSSFSQLLLIQYAFIFLKNTHFIDVILEYNLMFHMHFCVSFLVFTYILEEGKLWGHPYISPGARRGGSDPSVSWQSRNMMTVAYYACFTPVISLDIQTVTMSLNDFFFTNIIFYLLQKWDKEKKSHWKMSWNVIRVFLKNGAESISLQYF